MNLKQSRINKAQNANKPFTRQYKFLKNYFDEKNQNRTFGNASKSAIMAGYSKSYARCITYHFKWSEIATELNIKI